MNYIIISTPRAGSTYMVRGIKQSTDMVNRTAGIVPENNTPNNMTNLGEIFHHAKNINYHTLDENGVFIEHLDQRRNFSPELVMHPPLDQLTINRHMHDLIDNATSPWVAKVHMYQMRSCDLYRLYKTMARDDVQTIFLYREDTEDTMLSMIFSEVTGIWNSDEEQTYSRRFYDFDWHRIERMVKESIDLYNMYLSIKWDKIIRYEDFIGRPHIDFSWVGREYIENQAHIGSPLPFPIQQEILSLDEHKIVASSKKLLTKRDKMRLMKNYTHFHDVFINQCDRKQWPYTFKIK